MTAFEVFIEKIKKGMIEYCGEEYRVELDEVRKNNGVVYHGITVIGKQENISPTIYVDELFREYTEGMTLGQVMEKIIGIYEKHKIKQKIDVHFLTDYDWVKERVLYKLIGYEKNKELLKEIPHIRFLDMAIVFYCSILQDTLGSATVLIKNGLCRMWSVDAKELFAFAERNTPRILPPRIVDMRELIGEEGAGNLRMYVLTNQQKQFGAISILYPQVLERFVKEAGAELWILPSSIHEVILMPKGKGTYGEELREMVTEINRTQVACEEVLTDSVYYYDGKIRQF